MRHRASSTWGILDWYKPLMAPVQRSRRRISGSPIGKTSPHVWGSPGMSAAMAARLYAPLTGSTMKSTARFTGLVLHNSSHPGVQAQVYLFPQGGWTIRGPAFLAGIHIRFA